MSGTDDDPTMIFSGTGDDCAHDEAEAKNKNACLLALGGGINHTVFELLPGYTTIGRAMDVTFCLEFDGVSRHHLAIDLDQQSQTATIVDLGSRNGTYVNNQRLKSNQILSKGDIVRFGILTLQYVPYGDSQRLTYDQLSKQTNTDTLTGCYNRTYLSQATDAAVKKASIALEPVSLLTFDIDFFNKLKASIGEKGGDQILHEVAELMRMYCLRGEAICAHFDGDEFALLLPETDLEQGLNIAESVRKAVEEYEFRYNFRKWPVTISVGVAAASEDVATGKMLFDLADQGVLTSKNRGRNQVTSVQSPTFRG